MPASRTVFEQKSAEHIPVEKFDSFMKKFRKFRKSRKTNIAGTRSTDISTLATDLKKEANY
jgi:hypothetical protein